MLCYLNQHSQLGCHSLNLANVATSSLRCLSLYSLTLGFEAKPFIQSMEVACSHSACMLVKTFLLLACFSHRNELHDFSELPDIQISPQLSGNKICFNKETLKIWYGYGGEKRWSSTPVE